MIIFDAHTHLERDGKSLKAMLSGGDLQVMAAASAPGDCRFIAEKSGEYPNLHCCYGIHPWHADRVDLQEIRFWLVAGRAIGEIGMDNVWCDVDLRLQRRVFLEQLRIAAERNMPVVLHTKGCEEEIADRVRNFRPPILVHWYSCREYLWKYLDLDCYFSIGPDVRTNPNVRRLVDVVPLNRLMVESDGISGIEWATHQRVRPAEVEKILRENMRCIAELKGLTLEALADQLWQNAREFYGI